MPMTEFVDVYFTVKNETRTAGFLTRGEAERFIRKREHVLEVRVQKSQILTQRDAISVLLQIGLIRQIGAALIS